MEELTKGSDEGVRGRTSLASLASIAGSIPLILMLGYVVASSIGRYAFDSPLPATTEFVARWWMLPVAYFGLLVAHQRQEHIRVTLLADRLGDRARRRLQLFAESLFMIYVAAIGWNGLVSANMARSRGEYGVDSGLAVWPSRYVIPVAAFGTVALVLATWLRRARNARGVRRKADA